MKDVCHKISKGHYEYKGYKLNCIGYYPPESRVCWEAFKDDGQAVAHAYSLKLLKYIIDNIS